MLAGGTDPLYRQMLAAGHRHYVRVEVWSGDSILLSVPAEFAGSPEGGVVFGGGMVTATIASRVSRNLTLNVPFDLYPYNTTDLLAPFGNEMRIYRGVLLGDGSDVYVWPVFRGKLMAVSQTVMGCTLTASDRAADVVAHGFVSPQNAQTSNTVSEEFERLIRDALPDASFGASDVFSGLVQQATWEFDRGAALDGLATSVGAVWFPVANGDFVLRLYPWSVASSPVITLTDAAGGTVLEWQRTRSREQIWNVVTVTGERLNGDAPVYATAQDDVIGSPTSIFGNFGIRSRLERQQQPSTAGGAQTAADALLRTFVAPTEQWILQVVPDAALELGDVVLLNIEGEDVVQVVTDIAMPLDLSASMTVSTRSLVVGSGI